MHQLGFRNGSRVASGQRDGGGRLNCPGVEIASALCIVACARFGTVSGGAGRPASGEHDWVAGGLVQDF